MLQDGKLPCALKNKKQTKKEQINVHLFIFGTGNLVQNVLKWTMNVN